MRRVLAGLLVLGVLALGTAWWLKRESGRPEARLMSPVTSIGRTPALDIEVKASGPGLRRVAVHLRAGDAIYEIFSQEYPATGWRGSLVTEQRLRVEPDLVPLKIPEGSATLELIADTYAWHPLGSPSAPVLAVPVTVDLSPPQVAPLTTQHNMRLGGVDLAVWRVSADTVASHIEVDRYVFPGVARYFEDPSIMLGFFAIPQDLDTSAQPRLVAIDGAGNRREVPLPVSIKSRRFAERELRLDDDFLMRKVPELEQANGLPPSSNLVEGYLRINRDLRKQNESRIRELTAHSVPGPLWSGAFRRQPNAAPLSSFADRRTYKYRDEVIDHQTHLGFDLASLKLSPVIAGQNGIVVFAGNLGIYGNTVIIDHGLGIFTLYGHLSSETVREGDKLHMGQTLGHTGETGLAGGDHLHFSTMLHGIHVDPVEWWDAHWLRDHVTGKLGMFPHAAARGEAKQGEQVEDNGQNQP